MARIVVLGAGVAGHTAALFLKRRLKNRHEVVVVSPNSNWNWIPSNIWVGVGRMTKSQVVFPLEPIYRRKHIDFRQALATRLHPEGDEQDARPAVDITYTAGADKGHTERLRYDWLIDATGPRLDFEATPGLGPNGGHTASVCTADHAVDAERQLRQAIERLRGGEHLDLVIGMGNGTCTCEGAAFEYVLNVDHELRRAGVRDNATVYFFTNEHELGDFGVGGLTIERNGYRMRGEVLTESLLRERDIVPIMAAGATEITEDTIRYEQVDSEGVKEQHYDFAMLLPPFKGARIDAVDRAGEDITGRVFAPSGFMKVDANYGRKSYDEWRGEDWPKTYQNPTYPNLFAAGIAFAPPHPISKPRKSPGGVAIAPAPPRTGQPSGATAKAVALSIADMVEGRADHPTHEASMAHLAASCIASGGTGFKSGQAVSMVMSPIVPDTQVFPSGRNLKETSGEIGLAGHWLKRLLHTAFMYKMKARPFWWVIPE
ncbi:MAG: NAD(P)/FAD-dependent oxidoreductase [Pseudoclavibacter caeni]|jgi:sulfide:quinone oxidoreductase